LWHYKNDHNPSIRRSFQYQLAALFGRFFNNHAGCIRAAAGTSWSAITTVPSSRQREGEHPLEASLRLLTGWKETLVTVLEAGSEQMGHNSASDQGYRPLRDLHDESLLLVDDTFTSGARLQSAASALQLAGARVVAAVVLGRVIDPDRSDASRQLWDTARATPFDFATCCLED
jgi:predicted amidophosphoribosyltransferase